VSPAATVEGDERVRVFLALELPEDVAAGLARWRERHLEAGRPVPSFHVTLAFLGMRPRVDLDAVLGALREEAASAARPTLAPVRYRETRSVGMLVLDDRGGEATKLAECLHDRLERLGVYRREARPWLPHVTVVRFRAPPRLSPPLPGIRPFAPSAAAAFLSRLHPSGARYEVLESCSLGEKTNV
jgi:2'-5' RNA ligase